MESLKLIALLKSHQQDFSSVVPFIPSVHKIIPFDFSSSNQELSENILDSTKDFISFIDQKLKEADAHYAIGGYNEHRAIYSRSKVFDAVLNGEEPRRLHIGTDIWGKPNTAVIAPLDGIIHSFAFNNNFGDYGATIILSHSLSGMSFHTLYGHLSLNSIKNISEGDRICKGDVFAEFGIPYENGHWPPHLHFQVINDIGEWKGDYPGVCKYSEKKIWLENCPDPDLILQMNRFL